MGYIYKIKNDINDKVYVGQTRYTIAKRWKEHVKDLKYRDYPLYRAIRKYGIEHFHIEEIEECDNDLLNEKEIYYIELFNSFKNGYNATLGGDGVRKITKEEEEELVKLYKELGTCKKVAEQSERCPQYIGRLVRSKGIDTSINEGYHTIDMKQAEELFHQGFNITKIAEILNCSRSQIGKNFHKLGYVIEHVSKQKAQSVYLINKIDNKEKYEFNSYLDAAKWLVENKKTKSTDPNCVVGNLQKAEKRNGTCYGYKVIKKEK